MTYTEIEKKLDDFIQAIEWARRLTQKEIKTEFKKLFGENPILEVCVGEPDDYFHIRFDDYVIMLEFIIDKKRKYYITNTTIDEL